MFTLLLYLDSSPLIDHQTKIQIFFIRKGMNFWSLMNTWHIVLLRFNRMFIMFLFIL